ncbi:MAG: hypothetical protein ACOC0Q_03200, partial [Wenzhouxiangella sp.]
MKRLCLLLIVLFVSGQAFGETFRIGDIRVEGLQRISEGNVFSFLPVEVGPADVEAIKRLVDSLCRFINP